MPIGTTAVRRLGASMMQETEVDHSARRKIRSIGLRSGNETSWLHVDLNFTLLSEADGFAETHQKSLTVPLHAVLQHRPAATR